MHQPLSASFKIYSDSLNIASLLLLQTPVQANIMSLLDRSLLTAVSATAFELYNVYYILQPERSFFKIYFSFYFWLHWIFVAAHGISLVVANHSSLWCVVLLRWLVLLRSTGSRHAGFSSCGMWAQ